MADLLASKEPLPAGNMVGNRFVPTPWTMGLANALGDVAAMWQNKKADNEELGLARTRNDRFRTTLASMLGVQPQQDQGSTSAMSQEGAPYAEFPEPSQKDLYGAAFQGTPMSQYQVDPATQSMGLRAPKVTVHGSPTTPATPNPNAALYAQILALHNAGASPDMLIGKMIENTLKNQEQKVLPKGAQLIAGGSVVAENPETKTKKLTTEWVQAKDPKTGKALYDANNDPILEMRTFDPETGQIGEQSLGVRPGNTGTKVTQVNSTKDQFKNERDLRNDLKSEPIYKAYQEVRSAYDQINTALKQGTPIADVAAATKIMKLLDPGSVVRESELGIAMSSTGLLDRVTNYANQIIRGQKLTPSQRVEFKKLADEFYKASESQFNAKREEYGGIAKDYGLNEGRVSGKQPKVDQGLTPEERSELETLRKQFGKK